VSSPRVVTPETLDHLPADDPAARRSRRDLQRVHLAMGTRGILYRGLQDLVDARRAAAPLRILQLGAGDGTLLLAVARALQPAWPRVQLTLLDRLDLVSPSTRSAYAAQGWRTRVEVADVLDWARPAAARTTGAAAWDLVVTSLFLHHFEGSELAALLQAVARRSDRFFACEPRRGWGPLLGSHLVGTLGANAVTRRDAVLSVHAGFCAQELQRLWPGTATAWRCREFSAGLFSHCFSAQRRGVA